MIRTSHPTARVLASLVAVMTVAACSEPALPESAPSAEGTEDVLTEQPLDPARDELLDALETLTATVAAVQSELDTAATSEDAAAARSAADRALALLLDDPDTRSTTDPALFPARTTEREGSADINDLLSATLTAAREAGGPLGRATVETLREPVAGDLGAWERDAEGVVASASAVVRGARDVDAVADDVLTLPADGLRALAWTLLATGSRDVAVTRAAAERGSAHLAVVLAVLGLLDEAPEDPSEGDPEDDA